MSDISQEFLETLLQTQYMPEDAMRAYQRRLLEPLLRHARRHVPYYRDHGRLDALFPRGGEIDWDRWPDVPVLTRAQAQAHAAELYAEQIPPECGDVMSGYTAGSTGTPLAFRMNTLMAAAGAANMERGFVWADLPDDLSIAWIRNDKQVGAAYPHGLSSVSRIRDTVRITHHLAVHTPIEQQGYWLARVQPDIVMSYPGSLASLAQSLPSALAKHRFRLAICVGEVTTDRDRETIEAGFRCPVLDLYSGTEFGPIAVEDPRTRRLFVCEETALVECETCDGEFADEGGELSRLTLTPFYNYAMPLIRYVPGDYAVLDPAPPPDERTLRRFLRVAGRERNFFVMPSGRRWWPTYQNKILGDFLDYKQIQFAQTGLGRIEIRYASDVSDPVIDAQGLNAYLHTATPEPMEIVATRVSAIAQRASGKYEYATCEIDPALTAAHIDRSATGGPSAPEAGTVFAPPPRAGEPFQGPALTRTLFDTWRHSQFWTPAELQSLQRVQLEKVVRHARVHVPFYRDTRRLEPLFRTDGTIDWTKWTEIPPLTRAEVQRLDSALYAEELPTDQGRTWELTTSGSTGEPVRVVHDALSGEAVFDAVLLRDYERHGIDATQRIVRVRGFARAERESRVVVAHEFWSQQLAALGFVGRRVDIAEFLPPARIIDEIVAFRPKYLRINPVRLEQLCSWDRERRLGGAGIDTVLSYQEHLSEEARQIITDHIRCTILDRYGSNECGAMASSCPQCGRFHIHAESVFTEIVNDDGVPASEGEVGWVIATPLYNFAMPLIRYHHADRAKVGRSGLCPVTLPSLDSVIGKEPVMFKFAGAFIKPAVPPAALINYLGAQKFQVAQVAEDRCEFRIVPGRIPQSEMRLDEMTALLRARWWQDLKIDYRVMDELPTQDRRQKPAIFVREMKD